jgi:ABC-type antimicrobial peptide transport system permease subunit
MQHRRLLASSWSVLLGHKGRTLLSCAAVFVGVCAVTLMLGTGQSAQKDLDRRMEAMGTNVLMVQAGEFQAVGNRQMQVASFTTLVPADVKRLLEEVPALVSASGIVQDSKLVTAGREKMMASIYGVEPRYFAMSRLSLKAGRFFTEAENRAQARLAVLSLRAANDLRLGTRALGGDLRVEGVLFQVIGVLQEEEGGKDSGAGALYIPLATAMGRLSGRSYLDAIQVQARSGSDLEGTMGRMVAVLRRSHRLPQNRPNDFTVQDPVALLKAQHDMGAAFQGLMAAVAGVSLLTGCAGIAAVMLLSVRERTGEIGLRRAIGATRGAVAVQFLLEAAALSCLGGFVGSAAGFAGTGLACLAAGWPVVWPWGGAALSLGLSVGLGLLAGFLPAMKAAFLDPARALVSPG